MYVHFLEDAERGVCPGQVLALYSGNECLGGALIQRAVQS
jgi:tRNA U34 2-thiouridine synthase MnmA/TrmU